LTVIDKVVSSFDEAVADIPSGASMHVGGFGGPADWPAYLIAATARTGIDELTISCCNMAGVGPEAFAKMIVRMTEGASPVGWNVAPDHVTVALLLERGQVRKGITTFSTAMRGAMKSAFESMVEQGRTELELTGQGTLSERIRAARAGIPAFYTPAGADTPWAEGREVREIEGVRCVLETALHADFSLVRAHAADRQGNLIWDHPSSFNATMAGAATMTIAEVDQIVPLGDLKPAEIEIPGAFVNRVVLRPSTPMTSWREAH
jgi:3-oxoacid CoA-transferase A subunit